MMKQTHKHNINQETSSNDRFSNRVKCYPCFLGLTFAIVCWVLLLVFQSDFLFRVQELSLFLPTADFLKESLLLPGGLLSYMGCFLTQFFYYPWLGALFLVLLWLLVMFTVQKAFNIPAQRTLLALLPVLVLIASDLGLGYWMYVMKLQGYMFVATLGFLFAVSAIWLYRVLPVKAKFVFVLLWTLLGYPLFGFYALLGTAVMALISFRLTVQKNTRWSLLGLSLLCIIAVPAMWYNLLPQFRFADRFIMGLPIFEKDSVDFFPLIPFIVLAILPLIYAFIYKEKSEFEVKRPAKFIFLQLFWIAIALFVTQFWWEKDSNFYAEIEMNNAIEANNYEKVLQIARVQKQEPSRFVVMGRNLALAKLGRGGSEMFTYNDGNALPKNSSLDLRLVVRGGKLLYYHYAQFNFCYRWCMEDGVEYGWKIDYLKYAVKSLIASGEYDLAQKYINTLKKTLFYKAWATRYEAFLHHPELVEKDAEYASILPLYIFIDQMVGENSTVVEEYIEKFYGLSTPTETTKLFDEVSLMSILTLKAPQVFKIALVRYANSHKNEALPIHYQEAALLFFYLEKGDISKLSFVSSLVKKNFSDFMQYAANLKNASPEKIHEVLYPRFGDSYFYYYFFVANKTN